MQDRLNDILAFVRAVQSKSFTRAGERLGISRSAVGKSVTRLERHLGVRLLHRTTRAISLTQEGAAYFEYCMRALQELEEGSLAAATWRGTAPSGVLRMDLPVAFGRRHVLPLISAYVRKWPDICVHATFSDRFSDVVAEGIDLCIRVGGEEDNRLVSRALAANPFVVCGSPTYLAHHAPPTTPAMLAAHQCLTFVNGGGPLEWRFRDGARTWSLAVSGRLQLGNAESLRDAAVAGLGLVQLDTYIVADDLAAGRLVPVLSQFAAQGPSIRAVYPNRRYLAPKVRLFIDAAIDAWRNAPWTAGGP